MGRYPDMSDLARLATENYARIDSLDQIRPPYPATGTPNWWALRKRYEELLLGRIRISRKGERMPGNTAAHLDAAKWTALGNEQAQKDYERAGNTEDWWMARWNPGADLKRRKDWLDAQAEAARAIG